MLITHFWLVGWVPSRRLLERVRGVVCMRNIGTLATMQPAWYRGIRSSQSEVSHTDKWQRKVRSHLLTSARNQRTWVPCFRVFECGGLSVAVVLGESDRRVDSRIFHEPALPYIQQKLGWKWTISSKSYQTPIRNLSRMTSMKRELSLRCRQ